MKNSAEAILTEELPPESHVNQYSWEELLIAFANDLLVISQMADVIKEAVQQFSIDPAFASKMALAFGEGNDYSSLQSAWQAGEFNGFPTIELRTGAELAGANAAYAGSTNTIYFSQDFLRQYANNPQEIASVLLEEFGHSVDWQMNVGIDTLGDGGNLFSALVRGLSRSPGDLQRTQLENDSIGYNTRNTNIKQLLFSSGFFTVGNTGQVEIDYLFDCGGYKGELAIFSLEGLEVFSEGTTEFIKEVARRALSNSVLGYVIVFNQAYRARFSNDLAWEENFNDGAHQGVQKFAMRPGDTFGVMLIPNGTVQQVFDNLSPDGALRPLFSVVIANPNNAFQFKQIPDVNGNGNIFAMEDLRLDGESDLDYNDIVFRTGSMGNLDDLVDINPGLRSSEWLRAILEHASSCYSRPATQLTDCKCELTQQPLIGILDKAPIWIGQAINFGQWPESLVAFVDQVRESGRPNGVVNLRLELLQRNPDSSITTRYEFTPKERAALEYARQNHILIVAAVGNDRSVMSFLLQACQEFDNIITVGAVSGWDQADYSSYGYGLDILAPGGTPDNPILSTVPDRLGKLAGTSVATAKATGMIAQVWAANPGLSYRQVIEIINLTASDLNLSGSDAGTGAGLLNVKAAASLAEVTQSNSYIPPVSLTPRAWDGTELVTSTEQAVEQTELFQKQESLDKGKKVLVDSDLIIELFLNRERYSRLVDSFIGYLEHHNVELYITSFCVDKIHSYLGAKDPQIAEDAITWLEKEYRVHVIEPPERVFEKLDAIASGNLEHAAEVILAIEAEVDFIVSLNPTLYPSTKIPVVSIGNLVSTLYPNANRSNQLIISSKEQQETKQKLKEISLQLSSLVSAIASIQMWSSIRQVSSDRRKRVLADADLIIELFLNRERYSRLVDSFIEYLERCNFELYITSFCVDKIHSYLGAKDPQIAEDAITWLEKEYGINVIEPSEWVFGELDAIASSSLEHAAEVILAIEAEVDFIVSLNPTLYPSTKIPVVSINDLSIIDSCNKHGDLQNVQTELAKRSGSPFSEASIYWNLDKLFKDLEHVKGKELSLTEKLILQGLLCGYNPAEIANSICQSHRGVTLTLSQRHYRYIESLVYNRTGNTVKVTWECIPQLLEQLGYKVRLLVDLIGSNWAESVE